MEYVVSLVLDAHIQRAHAKEITLGGTLQHQSEEKSDALTGFTLRGKVKGMGKGKTLEVQGVNQEGRKGKVGRPRKVIPIEDLKKALRAAEIGIPLERVAILCGFPSGNAGPWHAYLKANPDFAGQLEKARLEGELDMSCVVRTAGPGWQGSAWLLERTRGYVARAQLDHTTKGKELSVSGSLLGAFGGQAK